MSWEKLNKWLERFKRFPLFKILYKIPGAPDFYHFILAFCGALLYKFPSRHIFVIGITGTKGKTTTLELLNSILETAGKKTALLSSLRVKIADKSEKNKFGNSMPGRFFVQNFLKEAVKKGCRYALIEATSQGVDLSRHKFINWNIGALTNLAPEHIEAHGSFEKYREAKLKFLRYAIERRGKVFLNKEGENTAYFMKKLARPDQFFLYSAKDENILHAMPSELPLRGAIDEYVFVWSDFNRENASAAIAIALNLGIGIKTIEGALRNFRGVPGRMEFVRRGGVAVIVDYAHTPDSLRAVYKTLREPRFMNYDSRLICVLGAAGGGRDKWKRPEMGKVVAQYCDEIILTSEDPYDEDPKEICRQIASGFSNLPPVGGRQREAITIIDRKEAIKKGVELARSGDIVAVTGMGSQDFMYLENGRKISWSERAVVEDALRQKAARDARAANI